VSLKLFAPRGYWKLDPLTLMELCNGCGTKGLGGLLVPDSLYGINITEACNIHDYMYVEGMFPEDKDEADRTFLNNMLRLITFYGGPRILQWLRRRRAYSYYLAVKHFGGPAFWNRKNPELTFPDVNRRWAFLGRQSSSDRL
jgi:hypothetical protein